MKLAYRSSLQSILENTFLALKHHSIKKKCVSWRLGQLFRCFEWKYCSVSENGFYMSVIYLHFSHCKFSLFSIDWVRFKKICLQRAKFRIWLPEQQSPQNLGALSTQTCLLPFCLYFLILYINICFSLYISFCYLKLHLSGHFFHTMHIFTFSSSRTSPFTVQIPALLPVPKGIASFTGVTTL